MNQRSQGTFEYLLLMAGLVLVAVIVLLVLRGGVLPFANSSLRQNQQNWTAATNLTCTGPNGTCFNISY